MSFQSLSLNLEFYWGEFNDRFCQTLHDLQSKWAFGPQQLQNSSLQIHQHLSVIKTILNSIKKNKKFV